METRNGDCIFCACLSKINGEMLRGESTSLFYYSCPNCGNYRIDNKNKFLLEENLILVDPEKRAILSYSIRRMQKSDNYPLIDLERARQILKNNNLPNAAEQADNFILLLGDALKGPGKKFPLGKSIGNYTAYIGALDKDNIEFIYKHLIEEALISDEQGIKLTLTFKGWQEYETLLRRKVESRKSFMAMPFEDFFINELFPFYKAAVEKTGFKLFHLGHDKKAGLIDHKLRVEIRNSRFLIAELTNGNKGAYWEAGFSEGLGRPVIYSCEKTYFDKKKLILIQTIYIQ